MREKILPHEGGVISLVGAGGKTTLMFRLARELADTGERVLTTTTTRILRPTKEQSASVVVSHDVKETASIADYAYLLSDGKVVDEGVPESLWNSASAWSKQFLHGEPDGPVAFHYPAVGYKEDLFEGGQGR